MSLAPNFAALRKRKGFNQKQMAEFLQVPYITYRQWETGRRQPAYSSLVQILAKINVKELFPYDSKKG